MRWDATGEAAKLGVVALVFFGCGVPRLILVRPNVRAETGAAVGRQAREEHDSHWRIAGLVHRRSASARARG